MLCVGCGCAYVNSRSGTVPLGKIPAADSGSKDLPLNGASPHTQSCVGGPRHFRFSYRVSGFSLPAGRTLTSTEAIDLAILARMEPYFDLCDWIHASGLFRSSAVSRSISALIEGPRVFP